MNHGRTATEQLAAEGDESRLHDVLAAYLEAERLGKAPASATWIADHADLTQELSAFLQDRERFRRFASAIPVAPVVSRSALPLPGVVAGYEVVSELGRGGMGVVYLARQVTLRRLVALKMILDGALADGQDLARFRSEAEAVGRLQHPNIVQIHEIGTHEGRPFFSLEYVDGGTLAQRIAGRPQPTRQSAALVETLARAIHHAHGQGIVHRDLKPANVLMTAQGMPKITDFGLAKRIEGSDAQTRTGAVLGTPSYLAPEQALGRKDVGPAADIYALGAILYELLTGRPPFRGDTPMETIFQAVSIDVPAPRLQRAEIPQDLETICLKCLEKEPRKRYASAEALAVDLRRFLTGEAISARPIGGLERAWRWCRRRPVVAGLLAAIVLLTLLGIGGILIEWRRAEAHAVELGKQRAVAEDARRDAEKARADAEQRRVEAEQARADAERQRQRAEANYQEARRVVDEFFTKVSENTLLRAPNLQPMRRELLAAAQKYYEDFLANHRDDPKLRAELADTHFRLGTVTAVSGDKARGLRELTKAQAIWQTLLQEKPDDRQARFYLARAQLAIGQVQMETGHSREAERSLDAGRGELEELLKSNAEDSAVRMTLIFAYNTLGILNRSLGRNEPALKIYKKAYRLTEDSPAFRTTPAAIRSRITIANNLAHAHANLGQGAEAARVYRRAVADADAFLKREPTDVEVRHVLAILLSNAALYLGGKDSDELLASYNRASEMLTALAEESPAITAYRFDLSTVWLNLAQLLVARKQPRDAGRFFIGASQLLEKLCKDDPSVLKYHLHLASARVTFAQALLGMSEKAEARRLLLAARTSLEELQRRHPDEPGIQERLKQARNLLDSQDKAP